jgi:hypothetical protein
LRSRLQQEGSAVVVYSHLPFELDSRDPNFARGCRARSAEKREMEELIAGTKRAIADSLVVIAEANRVLDRR